MTYGELFKLFVKRNQDLSKHINDYRPATGEYKIQIWFNGPIGGTIYARWIEEIEEFVFSEVDK